MKAATAGIFALLLWSNAARGRAGDYEDYKMIEQELALEQKMALEQLGFGGWDDFERRMARVQQEYGAYKSAKRAQPQSTEGQAPKKIAKMSELSSNQQEFRASKHPQKATVTIIGLSIFLCFCIAMLVFWSFLYRRRNSLY